MFLSASQIKIVFPVWHPDKKVSDKTECSMKWYNKTIRKLEMPFTLATNMGSVLHTCIENYLESGDTETGDPFPEGWDAELNPVQASVVKTLVSMGIDDGKVIKHTDRKIEWPLTDNPDLKKRKALLKKIKPTWPDDLLDKFTPQTWEISKGVLIPGFIDFWHSQNHIVDWKSSSNPQKYGLSLDKDSLSYLGHDVQLLLYAVYLRYVQKIKGPITVGHTYFQTKNKPLVREIKVEVPEVVLDKFYNWLITTVIPTFQELQSQELSYVKTLPFGENACDKYGGCAYRKICSGTMTEEEYKQIQKINKGVQNMGMMDKIKAVQAAKKDDVVKKVEVVAVEPVVADIAKEEAVAVEKKPRAKRSPKAKGFTLVVGANMVKGSHTTIQQLFDELTTEIAAEVGKPWNEMDAWARRALWDTKGETIAEGLSGKTIVCRFIEPETKALMVVLYKHATTLIDAGNLV